MFRSTEKQGYEELERQLKEVFKERSNILRQLSKTSKELEGIKVNLQSLKNDEASAKSDVQKLLELGQKQREEMKSLQEAFQKQLNEATEKAEKQQATINFLKTEMERKSKMIRDLQNERLSCLANVHGRGALLAHDGIYHIGRCAGERAPDGMAEVIVAHISIQVTSSQDLITLQTLNLSPHNKSLKNKLLSGNKLCGIHAEESKKIQAQLKEFRYGKKDLIFKAQQLTDLEQKLAIAKDKLEKAALDKESQLKALKETVQLCLSSVLHNQPPATNIIPSKPTEKLTSQVTNDSKVPFQVTNTKQNASADKETLASTKEANRSVQECDSQDVGKTCLGKRNNSTSPHLKMAETDPSFQKLHSPPWIKPEAKKSAETNEKKHEESDKTEEKAL
ncbi:leucine zipper protein 2 isoform X3 [Chrysemys picta bellii]|uniref:leucine zipper protein 2 isoform X3 n=1 Tax=Chrysemys picta bellii TaxID=8478 RepID=UPI0032B18736